MHQKTSIKYCKECNYKIRGKLENHIKGNHHINKIKKIN